MSDGVPLNQDNTGFEIYARLTTPLNTYPFDDTFGIDWDKKRFNSKQTIAVAVQNAIQPMVDSGKISNPSASITIFPANTVNININVTNPNTGEIVSYKFPPITTGI